MGCGLAPSEVLDVPPAVLDQIAARIWRSGQAQQARSDAQDARAGALMHQIVDGINAG